MDPSPQDQKTTASEGSRDGGAGEDWYRILFESIDEGACIVEVLYDTDGEPVDYRFLEANPAFEEQTGLIGAEGKRMRELAPGHEEHWFEIYGRVASTGEPVRFVAEAEDLGDRWYDVYAFRLGGPESRRVAILFKDIGERKRAEQERERLLRELETERNRLERIFEQAPAAIAVSTGPEHTIRSVNALYRRGFGDRDYVGRPAREVFPEADEQGFLGLMDGVYESGEPYVGTEERLEWDRTGDGTPEEAFFNFVYQPLSDAEGEVYGLMTFAVDVTQEVRARENIERLYQEVRAASRAKSDFLAVMSHELRTPLNAIMGYTDLLELGVPDEISEGARQQVGRIDASARHLLRIIEEILTFSRMEAGREEVRLETAELSALAREAAELTRALAEEQGLDLHVHTPEEPVEMRTDPDKVRQILLNLLSNAVNFTNEGEVSLHAELRDSGTVLFRVRDTGIGIAPEEMEEIFGSFTQAEDAMTREVGGTGLGLSVSRELARLLGGDVTVESAPGEGSTFTAELPVRVPEQAA